MLGNFHLELSLYGAIGTFINESGAEYLLTESGILDEGSLMGLIRGKYYNRCVRIHDIISLVMERKMYDTFMSTLAQERKDALDDLISNVTQDCGTQEQFLETSPIFKQHMGEFDVYECDDLRPCPSFPILEHVCLYGKKSAQEPDASSTYQR